MLPRPLPPSKPGPQPENQIAPSANEQLARVFVAKKSKPNAGRTERRIEAIEQRQSNVERLLSVLMLRSGG